MLRILRSICKYYPNHIFDQQSKELTVKKYFKTNSMKEPQNPESKQLDELATYFSKRVEMHIIDGLLSEWDWGDDKEEKKEEKHDNDEQQDDDDEE